MMKSALCVPGHVSRFIDYFKLSLLFSCTRAITWLEVIDLHMPWENILVCAQQRFELALTQRSKVHTMLFLSLAGYANPS